MRHLHKHWLGMVVTGLAAVLYVASLFPNVLHDPNNYLFREGGDGLKTYYVSAFYVKYDSGQRFTGMNYPVGEHVNYPDMQPIITGTLGLIHRNLYPIADYTIGIMNILSLLSMMVTPVILYAILRRTRLPEWYAAITALFIGFLAPQHGRIDGHLTLSYTCFVPLLWYFILRMLAEPHRMLWPVLFGTACVTMGMVTPYYTAVGAFFLLAHAVVLAWQTSYKNSPRLYWMQLGRMVFTALTPLLVFRAWLWFTDPTTDRPENPYGFFEYIASFTSVFVPMEPPLHDLWMRLYPFKEPAWEGWSYVGLPAVVVLIFTAVRAGQYLLRKQFRRVVRPVLPQHLRVGVWAAALLLLLAMCYPFKLPGMRSLVDLVSPLKQFRSLGRFAWPFYYVFTTYTAYYLYRAWRLLRQQSRPALAYGLLTPLLVIWALEANWHMHYKSDEVEQRAFGRAFASDEGNYKQLLTWANRTPADFQAILPLPYFTLGTDVFDIPGSGESIAQSYRASLNTGLPLLTVFLARASVGQTMNQIQLLSSTFIDKAIMQKFPSPKPILLLVAAGNLSPAEARLVGLSRKLFANEQVSLYELPLAALKANNHAAEKARADSLLPTLLPAKGLYSTTGKGALVESFDGHAAPASRLHAGAFYEPADKFSVLYDGPPPTPADTGRYEASVWVNARMKYGLGNMQVKQFNGGEMLDQQVVSGKLSTEIDGDWVRVAVSFRRRADANRLQVLYESRELVADDLMIRPIDTDVYYFVKHGGKETMVKNTYLLSSKLPVDSNSKSDAHLSKR